MSLSKLVVRCEHDHLFTAHADMGASLWQAQMSAEADAFIGIPGGFGTLEELLEMVTWQQLGLHTKPVGIYNMAGYFDHLLDFFDHAAEEVTLP